MREKLADLTDRAYNAPRAEDVTPIIEEAFRAEGEAIIAIAEGYVERYSESARSLNNAGHATEADRDNSAARVLGHLITVIRSRHRA